jgi:hypothetical protein
MTAVMAAPRPASPVRAGAGVRLLRAAVFTAVCVLLAAAGHSMASGRPVPGWSLALGWLAVFAVVAPLAGRERSLPGIAALLAVGQLALHAVFDTGQMCAAAAAAPSTPGTGTASGSGLMALAARLVCGADQGVRLTPSSARQVVAQAGLDPSTVGVPPRVPPMTGMLMPGQAGGGHPSVRLSTVFSMCSLPMLLGHLLAAVIAGWMLRRGEAALWRLIRLSVRRAASLSARTPFALRRAYALLSALAGAAPYPAGRRGRGAGAQRGSRARHRTVWLRHSLARRGPPALSLAA